MKNKKNNVISVIAKRELKSYFTSPVAFLTNVQN